MIDVDTKCTGSAILVYVVFELIIGTSNGDVNKQIIG
jgi:hypothetical protein